jgi:hypothetical protein
MNHLGFPNESSGKRICRLAPELFTINCPLTPLVPSETQITAMCFDVRRALESTGLAIHLSDLHCRQRGPFTACLGSLYGGATGAPLPNGYLEARQAAVLEALAHQAKR